jgi:uncharacterized protein (TIGR01777 family)
MNIVIAGATGFVGRHLIPTLLAKQHQITIVGRNINKIKSIFGNAKQCISWNQLNDISPDEIDIVINLAGENIAQSRWTNKSRRIIKESRVNSTTLIINWCMQATKNKPRLYNASAIGIYGLQPLITTLPSPLTELTPVSYGNPSDFLSEVGQAWESAAKPAIEANFSVTFMRFAVILKRHEGILKKLELPFSLGLGSVLGNGQQAFSWIHIEDVVKGILFLIEHPEITGAVNFSAPQCVSQKQFAIALANTMHRPLLLKMPAKMIKILFGEMGTELLLGSQNIYPERLKNLGFEFLYPDLNSALVHEWNI